MFEFFIAKRYLRSKHKINFITIISILSTLGVMIGVAALVIMLSVFNGFGGLVKSILIEFDPHIRITNVENAEQGLENLIDELNGIDEIKSVNKYAQGKIIALNQRSFEILDIKGIDEKYLDTDWGVASKIVSGEMDLRSDDGYDKIILGLPISLRLSARVGDTIYVSSANTIEKSITSYSIPQTKPYIVTGLFEANNKNFDYKYCFTSLSSAQSILGLRDNITGLELRLNDFDNSDKIKDRLEKKYPGLSIYTWYDLHKELFDVMIIERWGAYILLALIIAIATFNILGSLTMSVIEKKKDIGVLRSMGVSDKSILRIFMFEGMLIGFIGTIIGMIIGYIVCWIQINYNIYPLDPAKYVINTLPILIKWTDFLAVGGAAFLLTFLSSLYPAKKAVQVSIIDAIKWE